MSCSCDCILLEEELSALNSTVIGLEASLSEALGVSVEDPCAEVTSLEGYDRSLHIGAIFIVLGASLLGVLSTTAGKHLRFLRLPPFLVAFGKTVGTGIVLATALVHMLLPSNLALTSPCVPESFNTDYAAYAYLFAMLTAMAVQNMELWIKYACQPRRPVTSKVGSALKGPAASVCTTPDCPEEPVLETHSQVNIEDSSAAATGSGSSDAAEAARSPPTGAPGSALPLSTFSLPVPLAAAPHGKAGVLPALSVDGSGSSDIASDHGHGHGHSHSHHSGGVLPFLSTAQSDLLAALMAEVGFSIHSVLIGIAVGVVSDDELKVLLIALCFHQFFEGIALGARLAATSLSVAIDVVLVLLFSIAAPIGIGAGVGLVSAGSFAPNSSTFLLVQGSFDGICAGILLQIGFSMLTLDLPADLAAHCDAPGKSRPMLRRMALFAALWGGAGMMAFLGRYL